MILLDYPVTIMQRPEQGEGSTHRSYVTVLNSRDVLFGRGVPIMQSPGNTHFRKLVQAHRADYLSDSNKQAYKDELARRIIWTIQALGGRFLRRVETEHQRITLSVPDHVNCAYFEVDTDAKMKKVKQALRERDPVRGGTTHNKRRSRLEATRLRQGSGAVVENAPDARSVRAAAVAAYGDDATRGSSSSTAAASGPPAPFGPLLRFAALPTGFLGAATFHSDSTVDQGDWLTSRIRAQERRRLSLLLRSHAMPFRGPLRGAAQLPPPLRESLPWQPLDDSTSLHEPIVPDNEATRVESLMSPLLLEQSLTRHHPAEGKTTSDQNSSSCEATEDDKGDAI